MTNHPTSKIKRNTVINLTGSLIPLGLSLLTVPVYLQLIGSARYGVLAIIWVLLGYFGVFDLGLSKASSNQIARLHDSPVKDRERFFWTAISFNAILGSLGGLVLFISGHFLLGNVFRMPDDLRTEALEALPWVSLAVPAVTVSFVLVGSLEGREKFFTLNLLTTLTNLLLQLIPLTIAWWHGPNLSWLIGCNVLLRLGSAVLLFFACYKYLPLTGKPIIDTKIIGTLFRYGGWITITGIIGPILTSVDQLVIGIQAGVQVVTYYTVPFNLVTYLWVLPSSLSRTLFPHFSKIEKSDARMVGHETCLVLGAIMTPIIITGVVGLRPFLEIWLGSKMAISGGIVGEILLIGIWFNSLAFIPYSLLQGQGRPDLIAKFHLLELIPHLLALWLGLAILGVAGAAWAWTLRVALDSFLLFWAARILKSSLRSLLPAFMLVLSAFLASFLLFDLILWRLLIGGSLITIAIYWSMRIIKPQIKVLLAQLPGFWKNAGSQP